MKHVAWILPVLVLATVVATARPKDPKVEDTVPLARTWEAAVAEAKLLNVPIVVHSHGFY
jgi:hypothetical protein